MGNAKLCSWAAGALEPGREERWGLVRGERGADTHPEEGDPEPGQTGRGDPSKGRRWAEACRGFPVVPGVSRNGARFRLEEARAGGGHTE